MPPPRNTPEALRIATEVLCSDSSLPPRWTVILIGQGRPRRAATPEYHKGPRRGSSTRASCQLFRLCVSQPQPHPHGFRYAPALGVTTALLVWHIPIGDLRQVAQAPFVQQAIHGP